MKILFLSDDFLLDSDIVGGATIASRNLAEGLSALGHEILVISASKKKEKCGSFKQNGLTIERIYSPYFEDRWRHYRSVFNIGVIRSVEKLISEFKPDVVLAHTIHLYLSYYVLRVARRYSKVYFVAHDIMPFYPGTFTEFIDRSNHLVPSDFNYRVNAFLLLKKFKFRFFILRNFFIKKWLNASDGVIAVSRELRVALQQNGILVKSVIHNGIDVSKWYPDSIKQEEFVNKFGLKSKKCVFFQGRLSGAKGGYIIVKAMRDVVASCPEAILLVAGNIDDYAGKMKKYADEMGILKNLIFIGWLTQDEIRSAYHVSSVVVVPSVCFDSFPNANLEAFACKKPVIATCFGGSKEIVRDNKNGFIVNPFNIELLVRSIVYLLCNPEKAREFGEEGFRMVKEKYSIAEMSDHYLRIFGLQPSPGSNLISDRPI